MNTAAPEWGAMVQLPAHVLPRDKRIERIRQRVARLVKIKFYDPADEQAIEGFIERKVALVEIEWLLLDAEHLVQELKAVRPVR